MSLLWIDGFDTYGTTNGVDPAPAGIISRSYTVGGETNMKVRDGRLGTTAGGNSSLGLSAAAQTIQKSSLTTNHTMVIGFAIYFTNLGSAAGESFLIFKDGAVSAVSIKLDSVGNISVINASSTVLATCQLNLSVNTWYYFEIKVKTATSAIGTVEIRSGNTVLAAETGKLTNSLGTNEYSDGFLFKGGSFQQCYIDDLYVLDTAGAVNNDFLGNIRITTLFPTGDAGTNQWTASANASHYTLVDEPECNDDTDYIEDTVSGNVDLWDYPVMSGVSSIYGLVCKSDSRETDANNFPYKMQCVSGATTANGANLTGGTTSYVTRHEVWETDPDANGAAWDGTSFGVAQFGVMIT